MTHEVPGKSDQNEELRETLQSELEQLPVPVRTLYERARGLVTEDKPGFNRYTVDVDRFSQLLAGKGVFLSGAPIDMVSVFVGGEHSEFPKLTAGVGRYGVAFPSEFLQLSTRGLLLNVHRDEDTGVLITGRGTREFGQESVTALAFTEALLDSVERKKGHRYPLPRAGEESPLISTQSLSYIELPLVGNLFDTPKSFIFNSASGSPEVDFESVSDADGLHLAESIRQILAQFDRKDPPVTPGHFVIVE
jgi:hypothetical protein